MLENNRQATYYMLECLKVQHLCCKKLTELLKCKKGRMWFSTATNTDSNSTKGILHT